MKITNRLFPKISEKLSKEQLEPFSRYSYYLGKYTYFIPDDVKSSHFQFIHDN